MGVRHQVLHGLAPHQAPAGWPKQHPPASHSQAFPQRLACPCRQLPMNRSAGMSGYAIFSLTGRQFAVVDRMHVNQLWRAHVAVVHCCMGQCTLCCHFETGCVLQEWPELGGGTTGVAGPQPSSTIEQPAAASVAAPEALQASGQQARQRDSNATPKPAKAEASGRSPAKASSSSPDQRHPSTPSPANAHPHSPETPVSGQTTASVSPAGTPSSAVISQHHIPHASHKHRRGTSASPSDWAQGTAHQAELQQQLQQQQQQQQQQGMPQLPAVSSSSVQQDPVVQLVSRRSSGRVPPPGFSGPVAAPSTSAAANTGARSKVRAICFVTHVLFRHLALACNVSLCWHAQRSFCSLKDHKCPKQLSCCFLVSQVTTNHSHHAVSGDRK